MDFDALGEMLATFVIIGVIVLVLAIVGGTVCGVVTLCTHEDVADITETVDIVEVKALDEGYAYCVRSEYLDGETWFRVSSDSFYLDSCEDTTLNLHIVHTKDAFGDHYSFTLIDGEKRTSVYTINGI